VDVGVVVHPIDTLKHPTQPTGWRWAVMVDGASADDISRCANAGWAIDQQDAIKWGDAAGAAAARCLQFAGSPVRYLDPVVLDHDPTPSDDRIHVI
jgi:hypothetical protein